MILNDSVLYIRWFLLLLLLQLLGLSHHDYGNDNDVHDHWPWLFEQVVNQRAGWLVCPLHHFWSGDDSFNKMLEGNLINKWSSVDSIWRHFTWRKKSMGCPVIQGETLGKLGDYGAAFAEDIDTRLPQNWPIGINSTNSTCHEQHRWLVTFYLRQWGSWTPSKS